MQRCSRPLADLTVELYSQINQNDLSDPKVPENEPPDDKTNKMICVPSEDSDQPGHLPSLISLHCALNG